MPAKGAPTARLSSLGCCAAIVNGLLVRIAACAAMTVLVSASSLRLPPAVHALFDADTGFLDLQTLARLAALGATQLQCAHRVHALDDLTENGVLAVEPGRRNESQEELAAVGARPGIGHAEEAGPVVLDTGIELPIVLIAGAAGPAPQWTAPCAMKSLMTRWKIRPS